MKNLSLPQNWHHIHHDTVASTMLCCDPQTVEPGEFLLVTADEQTAGRGQRGTTWESTKGENLTFNIGWKSPIAPVHPASQEGEPESADRPHWPAANEQFLISEITALAVAKTLDHYLRPLDSPQPLTSSLFPPTSSQPLTSPQALTSIKWPNDIYVGDRKICGMLLEHQLAGKQIASSIAGIGINVNQAGFATLAGREEGRGAPISLHQIVGHEVSREAVLEAFVRHFCDGIRLLQEGRYEEVEQAYTALLYRRTGWHRYRDAEGEFMGEFVGIARNGLLTLRKQDGSLGSYAFKEVTYVI